MRKLTILAAPVNAVGHVNAVAGALQGLAKRGHRIIFVIEEAFKGKLTALGYEETIYTMPKAGDEQNPGESVAKLLLEGKMLGNFSTYEKLENMIKTFHGERNYEELKLFDLQVKQAINEFSPDILWFDGAFLPPVIHYSGIPWVFNVSCTPITFIFDDEGRVPPGCSGLPSDGNLEKYKLFNDIRKNMFHAEKFSELVKSMGYEPFPDDSICPESYSLTVYAYPDELNYPFIRSQDWFNLEVFQQYQIDGSVKLEDLVPDEFALDDLGGKWSGKYIYVSMGSMGGIDLGLMNRVLSALAKTNHKCIVSKGPRHAEIELAANMWGERYLPQTKIVPLVDLVITHGGNNTVTETFATGTPMIVMALFGDQFDNARRLEETGLGASVQPYRFTDDELIGKMDKILNNKELYAKLAKASKRILSTNQHEKLAKRIEEMFGN